VNGNDQYYTYNEITRTYNPFYPTADGESYYEQLPTLDNEEPEQYYYNPTTNQYQPYNGQDREETYQ
jgi:hypothetical protein